jgi:hypothetical protein
VVLLLIAGALSLLAHHSAAAEHEAKVIRLEGALTRVDWTNPHVWFLSRCQRRQREGDELGSGGEFAQRADPQREWAGIHLTIPT